MQYDSSQSPLALLAQTCSNIGQDSSSFSYSAPPIITSLVSKTSSNLSSVSTNEKSSSATTTKRSLPSQLHSGYATKKATLSFKAPAIGMSSSFDESSLYSSHLPPLFDPTSTAAAYLLRSSLAYLAAQQQQQQHSYSSPCSQSGCLQCETVRHILAASAMSNQVFTCHWPSCNARFTSNPDLAEHIQQTHKSSKVTHSHRFHPYFKPSMTINNNDQLPFFYPHLSLSPLTAATRRLNNNTNNKN